MIGRRYEEFLDSVVDILRKDLEEELIATPVEFRGVTIDMPKKGKLQHGSSYRILCNTIYTWCTINGDLVVNGKDEETTHKIIEKSDCKVFDIHRYISKKGEENKEESHIHFMCVDKDRQDTVRMINFLKSR